MSLARKIIVAMAVSFTIVGSRASTHEQKNDPKAGSLLVGTWHLVSTKRDGIEAKLPRGATLVKHVTPTHYMAAMYDEEGQIKVATGGRYTLKGDDYEELPEYSSAKRTKESQFKAYTFKCKIETNRWIQTGKTEVGGNSVIVEQLWERVESK